MASSEHIIGTDERGNNIEGKGTTIEYSEMETALKKENARARSNFTRAKNKILSLIEGEELPRRRALQDACCGMDTWMERAMETMSRLSDLYGKHKERDKDKKVVMEMEKLESEFATASETAREYMESRRDDKSSVCSEILSINLENNRTISDQSETYQKQKVHEGSVENSELKIAASSLSTAENASQKMGYGTNKITTKSVQDSSYAEQSNTTSLEQDTEKGTQDHLSTNETCANATSNQIHMNPRATPFHPTAAYAVPSIGQDLWRQLKRVQIPVFSGDKRTYQSWKAAFLTCIDSAPATGEYKLLQLRQYLAGEALKVIENLGHSATAHEAAKDRLERKYGGRRRQIAVYLEELEQFKQVRSGNAKDLEKFADLLDIAIINLQKAGQYQELGDGSLYNKLQRKLPEAILAQYHRWIFENSKPESVYTLRAWVIQESEFQTIASETVPGLAGRVAKESSSAPTMKFRNQRTFFGDAKDSGELQKFPCKVCGKKHGVWGCPVFKQKSVSDRWDTSKQFQLCFRCLADGHNGKSCPRSQQCGINGCKQLHHRLLHRSESTRPMLALSDKSKQRDAGISGVDDLAQETAADRVPPVTEGKAQNQPMTMMTQDHVETEFIGLRTVPVILKNGDRSVKVNALLDDASTKKYVNADVAAEIGLKGKTEKVTVNVLNGQIDTFETQPINVRLKSISGKVSIDVTAYTANRVTGSMPVVDWNSYKRKWPHLRNIDFPRSTSRPIVDVLIGLDCADLHYALEEIRGRPGEPVARLTPLGWTCIGNPGLNKIQMLQTSYACTYFVKETSEIDRMNQNLKKFWEIESTPSPHETPIVHIEEQLALKKVEKSITFRNEMYRVGVPWNCNEIVLPNNYIMALQRLENTEKRLKRAPDIATAYNQCIERYIEKGYLAKVSEKRDSKSRWYLPHFPVLKPDKDTTKTRIMFDAAAKFEGVSLNDKIFEGLKLQRDLFDVLLRFRRLPVAVVCDIEEMYLRIGTAQSDKQYHSFLWRGLDQDRAPDVYEFDRVVFGVNSSPFQAQFVLQQHAKKYRREYPRAAETISKSTYMDDSMDSVLNEKQGVALYKELSALLAKAGMHARKWLSSSSRVLQKIPQMDRKSEVDLDKESLPTAKTHGVWWLAGQDVFTFRENAPDEDMKYTKRNFLKKIATLFDPVGLLAPFTIRAKILLQDMWTAGLEWDEEMNESLSNSARTWFTELHDLQRLKIHRCLQEIEQEIEAVTLHTFVDASEEAYGAVVYARFSYRDGSASTNIVTAKTRVAPSVATSIPRLELMAAVIGVRLTSKISTVLEIPISRTIFWSDSMNVLWWIRGRSRQFKPFVANRVGEIQSSTDPEQWRYVPTEINPADLLSQGLRAIDLEVCERWWRGPAFLQRSEEAWPLNKLTDKPTGNEELKRSTALQKRFISQAAEYTAYANHMKSRGRCLSVRLAQEKRFH